MAGRTVVAHEVVERLRHPKERSRNAISLVVGLVGWGLVALIILGQLVRGRIGILVVYLLYALVFTIVVLISAAPYRARAIGHHVMITEKQFPRLYRMLVEGAGALGLDTVPSACLYNSGGITNAFARRLLGGRYVFLASALVEADTDAQVRFVIGHELGHHAAGHLDWCKNLLKLPSYAVPFLHPAYSRGRELTCDRIGLHLSGDPRASGTALQMLACGCRRLNQAMDLAQFEVQERMVPPVAGWFVQLLASHPRTTQRVREISQFAAGGIAPDRAG